MAARLSSHGMPRNVLVRKLFGCGKRGDNFCFFFFIAVNFTRRILINGIRSSALAHCVCTPQSSRRFDYFVSFSLGSFIVCILRLICVAKVIFIEPLSHQWYSIAKIKTQLLQFYIEISAECRWQFNSNINKAEEKTTHTHTHDISNWMPEKKKCIVQLFVCRKKKWQLFGVVVFFSFFLFIHGIA